MNEQPPRRRCTRAPVGRAALAVIVLLALLAAPASAQDSDSDEIPIEVTVGTGGYVAAKAPIPVRVRISSDRLIAGELEVMTRFNDSQQRTVRPVEIPGGSVKEFVVLAPNDVWSSPTITVSLREGGETLTSKRVRPDRDPAAELIGVMPDLAESADIPARLDLAMQERLSARTATMSLDLLDLGLPGLAGLDSILALESDVAGLAEQQRATLLHWVASGGVLLVDAAPGGELRSWPAEAQPGPLGWQRVGQGSVHLTDSALRDGRVQDVLQLTTTSNAAEEGHLSGANHFNIWTSITMTLAQGAGFRLPDEGKLLRVLLLYALLLGPITALILRRIGRRTLAWITVPVLAVVFTAVIYGQGEDLRQSTGASHSTVLEVTPYGTVGSTNLLVGSRRGGPASVVAPASWTATGLADESEMFFGFEGRARDLPITSIRAGASDTAIDMDLGPGEFRGLQLTGPVAGPPQIAIDAESGEAGAVSATVTNNLDVALHEVAVFVEDHVEVIEQLPAGAEATVEFDNVMGGVEWRDVDEDVWSELREDEFGMGFDPRFGPGGERAEREIPTVDASLWVDYHYAAGFNLRTPGEVTVVGWTSDLILPLRHSGGPVDAGTTVVVGRDVVRPVGSLLSDAAVGRRLVWAAGQANAPFGGFVEFAPGVEDHSASGIYQFLLPGSVDGRAVDLDRLVLHLSTRTRRAELYVGGEWINLYVDRDADRIVLLPPEAMYDGRIFLRFDPAGDLRTSRRDPRFYEIDDDMLRPGAPVQLTTIEDLRAIASFFLGDTPPAETSAEPPSGERVISELGVVAP